MDASAVRAHRSAVTTHLVPNLCRTESVFLLVVIVQVLALILVLYAQPAGEAFWTELGLTSLFVQWVALSSAGLLCTVKRWVNAWSAPVATAAVLALVLGVTAATTSAITLLAGEVLVEQPTRSLFANLAIASLVTLGSLRYFYVRQQWRAQVEAQARAKLDALQARIRPHFLFNALNTVATLIPTRPQAAEDALLDFADLFRAALTSKDRISLKDELDLVQRYLALEQHRLGDRLAVVWQIDPEVSLAVSLPALTLQPLVENAVYHGIQPLEAGGEVTIRLDRHAGWVHIAVVNPLPAAQGTHHGLGMAQDNVRQRLIYAFGDEVRWRAGAEGGDYRVEFRIPTGG